MKRILFFLSFLVLFHAAEVLADDIAVSDSEKKVTSGSDIKVVGKFLDELFENARITLKNIAVNEVDSDRANITFDVDFDLTHLCNNVDLDTVPVINVPSHADTVSTGLEMSYYFFANEKEKPILRFAADEKNERALAVKEYIDNTIFRYLIIQVDLEHFDQIFLSSRSGISLKETFNFVIPGVSLDKVKSNEAKFTILIVDKKRPRGTGPKDTDSRIIVRKEHPLVL